MILGTYINLKVVWIETQFQRREKVTTISPMTILLLLLTMLLVLMMNGFFEMKTRLLLTKSGKYQ